MHTDAAFNDPLGPMAYSYCLRSSGRFHHLVTAHYLNSEDEISAVSPLLLEGSYVAFVEQFPAGHGDVTSPGELVTKVVDVTTGVARTVPDPGVRPGSGEYSFGVGQSLVLSPAGVVAATGSIYILSVSAGFFSPVEEYVLAFQAPTGRSVVVGSGPPGALGNLRVFQCAAGCSPAAPTVVGWTSNGTAQYAGLPAAS